MSDEIEESEVTVVEDVNLVAYLIYKGFVAIPYMKEVNSGDQKRVVWDVQGESAKVNREVRSFYQNTQVGIRDYIRALKEVRTDLYTVKSINVTRD